MKTITITEDQTNTHNLPAKAIGYWAIVEVTDEFAHLHRLKKDGSFGSYRPNNVFKLSKSDMEKLEPNDEKLLTGKASNGENVVIARMHTEDISEPIVEKPTQPNIKMEEEVLPQKIGTRKSRWIADLIEAMKQEPFTLQIIEKLGKTAVADRIIADTNPSRLGGKLYSSIASGMRVWNSRAMKGDF